MFRPAAALGIFLWSSAASTASPRIGESEIAWQPSLAAALEAAKRDGKSVFVAVNMDGERANDTMVKVHYRDPGVTELARGTVSVFASKYDHGSGERPCPRAGSVPCSAHMAAEKEVRRLLLDAGDGVTMIAPSHAFLAPDGKILFSVAYQITVGELSWCLAEARKAADPAYSWTPCAGARAPLRLVQGAIADPTAAAMPPAPTQAQVDEILAKLKGGAKPWQLRDELAMLLRSADPRAMAYVGSLLTAKGAQRNDWLAGLVHEIGRLSPPEYWEVLPALFADERPTIRREVAVALEQLAAEKSAAKLLEQWKKEKDPGVRGELVRAIAATAASDKKAIKLVLDQAAAPKDEPLRIAALVGAARLADRKALDALARAALTDPSPGLRAAGAYLAAACRELDLLAPLEAAALLEADPRTKQAMERAVAVRRGGKALATLDQDVARLTGSDVPRDRP